MASMMAAEDEAKCSVYLGKPLHQRPTARELNRILTKYCTQWKSIGLHLGLTREALDIIEINHHHVQPNECFRDTLHRWLEIDVNASWATLELSITNANREKDGRDPLDRMPPPSPQPMPPQQMVAQTIPVYPMQHQPGAAQPLGNRPVDVNRAYTPQGSTANRAGIQPETAPTTDCGKGIVKDAVFTEVKRAVCRVNARMVGTGFIGYMKLREKYATVFITNNHVITNEEDAMGSRLTFENAVPGSSCVLQGCNVFKRNGFWFSPEHELDYSVIEVNDSELKDPNTNKQFSINSLQLTSLAHIKDNDQVHVIQHPHGGELSQSSSESYVKCPLLLYQCTTEQGSSGSPVLKEVYGELKVVALHRGGRDGYGSNLPGFNCGTLIQEISNHINGSQTNPVPHISEVQQHLRRHVNRTM